MDDAMNDGIDVSKEATEIRTYAKRILRMKCSFCGERTVMDIQSYISK